MELLFLDDPAAFLDLAGDHLAAEPVLSTVVATVAQRAVAEIAAGLAPSERSWWLVVRDGGALVGAAMRTAPGDLWPAYVLPMPEEAARLLARSLHERGEFLGALNGALPAARVCAEETARLSGGVVRETMHVRLFELGELRPARPVPGGLRIAEEDDLDLVVDWFAAFHASADEQAGRAPTGADIPLSQDDVRRRVLAGRVWLWVDDAGERVHLTAANPPSFGVTRVGPVYTPSRERGRGWASAAVHAVSAQILASGSRACLFTDQANPTSNAIYRALGYEPVVDMVNLLVE